MLSPGGSSGCSPSWALAREGRGFRLSPCPRKANVPAGNTPFTVQPPCLNLSERLRGWRAWNSAESALFPEDLGPRVGESAWRGSRDRVSEGRESGLEVRHGAGLGRCRGLRVTELSVSAVLARPGHFTPLTNRQVQPRKGTARWLLTPTHPPPAQRCAAFPPLPAVSTQGRVPTREHTALPSPLSAASPEMSEAAWDTVARGFEGLAPL